MSHSTISSLLTKLSSSIVTVLFCLYNSVDWYRNILTVDRDVEQCLLHSSDVDI